MAPVQSRSGLATDETTGSTGARAPGGRIPFGALVLLGTLIAVFAYGIYLKSAGPPSPGVEVPVAGSRTLPSGRRASPGGATEETHVEAIREPAQKPLIPDSPAPAPQSSVGTRAPSGPPSTGPVLDPPSTPAAPRGAAPGNAERRARELFRSKQYLEASLAWREWARTVPAGSWTVQIAALRLDRAQASRALASLGDRDNLFLLPPGGLPNGLSPVCIGVYAAADDARRAAAPMAPFPGSSSRPFPRRLDSLSGRP